MLICPYCHLSEYVRQSLKHPGRATCDNCERSFDIPKDGVSKPKSLKLFLSYPHTPEGEYNLCDEIAAHLKARGHEVWFDKEQLTGHHGVDWRRRIAQGIRESQLVLSCLNSHAVRVEDGRRGVCLDELSIAISVKGGNVNTVLLESADAVKPSAALSHRQWLDMSRWKDMRALGEEAYRAWLEEKLQELTRMVESEDNYLFDGEITQIAKKLGMTDYSLDKRELLEKPFVGREWLGHRVDAWLDDPRGGALCALYGDPGVGKSAFAVQYAFSGKNVAAILCFAYGNPHYNSVPALVRCLAYQLACRLPDYRAELLRILDEPAPELSDGELFDRLLTRPLTRMHIDGKQETLCVVLDGLDEGGEGEKNAAAAVLGQCAGRFPKWLRVLVTSRREAAVLGRLAPGTVIELLGKSDDNLSDIRTYFDKALAERLPKAEERQRAAEALTKRSEGSFLYAYLTAEAIGRGDIAPFDESAYPKDINAALLGWMERLFPDPQEFRRDHRLPLGALLASPEPLPQEELERLLGMSESAARDMKRRLTVFLEEGSNAFDRPTLSFQHRYVRDWLGSEAANEYAVSARDGLKALAQGCFARFENSPQELTGYEALYLFELLEKALLHKELHEAILSEALFARQWDLGDWCQTWGKYEPALRLYEAMFKSSDARMRMPGTPDARRSLLISYNKIAGIYEAQGRFEDALKLYQKCLELSEALAAELGTPDARRDLSVSYERIADIYKAQGRLEDALKLY
ncbi:MAG: toll/interleukin-1 receptor domain-containing protein, partial [Clostridia bacterium]|nr:toll/interleukin-1 receptor domain-containing protein [Clostridia bacterium]